MTDDVGHLIFDVESVADGRLISSVRYPGDGLSPAEAIERYQKERLEQTGSTFIPHTFMVPIAVVIAKVSRDFRLLDIVSLDEPAYRPHVITKHFWQGWEIYGCPQWVTFNGRSFDLPLMELSAFRFGLPIAKWFSGSGYQSPRNRFCTSAHLDLQELLTNFGAAKMNGGLNLAAQMLGKPGKMGIRGEDVQSYHDRGEAKSISDYCRCDVLDTYFVFLRSRLMTGKLVLAEEQKLVEEARDWIERQSESCQACADYLAAWNDWHDPWTSDTAFPLDEHAGEDGHAAAEGDAAPCSDVTEPDASPDDRPGGRDGAMQPVAAEASSEATD